MRIEDAKMVLDYAADIKRSCAPLRQKKDLLEGDRTVCAALSTAECRTEADTATAPQTLPREPKNWGALTVCGNWKYKKWCCVGTLL